jgi:hypothetical protein
LATERNLTALSREVTYFTSTAATFEIIGFGLQQPLHGAIPNHALQAQRWR